MKPQWLKTLYFSTMARLTVVNYGWRRIFPNLPKTGRAVLHLGCGANYISRPGVINVDGNLFCRKDLWLDITLGLPFPDETIDVVLASHLLEHLDEKRVRRVLRESHRVLKPGGKVRLVTPDLKKAIDAYQRGDAAYFSDWPDHRRSLGGKFNNELLCRDQHRLMFDFSFLEEMLMDAGFVRCREVAPEASSVFDGPEWIDLQGDGVVSRRSLFIEADKG